MDSKIKVYIIIALVAVALIVVYLLRRNVQKTEALKMVDDLNVRFNTIKTIPLAFKLNKAQAMARRSKETSEQVKEYYERYEEAQKRIDEINTLFEDLEDAVSFHRYSEAKRLGSEVSEKISESEKEVQAIDAFLEQFSLKEKQQREYSIKLKEDYRQMKLWSNANAPSLSIANDGVAHKFEKCEDLFSSSEEWLYANDFIRAQDDLQEVETIIDQLKHSLPKIPELVKDAKGVVPVMQDELSRQYALARQRGIYTDHLNIDGSSAKIKERLNTVTKTLMDGEIEGVSAELGSLKEELKKLLADLGTETEKFVAVKVLADSAASSLAELRKVNNYVSQAFEKGKERYGLDDLNEVLDQEKKAIDDYSAEVIRLANDSGNNTRPSSVLYEEYQGLSEKIAADIASITEYKHKIDKNTSDEARAVNQLMKLQIVLNEVEVKVKEYRLPAIAGSYHDDLLMGREKIAQIKALLAEIPLNIEKLNTTLDETISYIYTFYNNVNNIVGMAIMVEDAIVLGNKYRSTHPEVDRDLSKAEFSYLNGEYTKAFRIAIACMESLFPEKADQMILENASGL